MLYRLVAPDRYGGFFLSVLLEDVRMPNRNPLEVTEPVGIVISRGDRDEPTPTVFAYVWGAAPESEVELEPVRAPRAA